MRHDVEELFQILLVVFLASVNAHGLIFWQRDLNPVGELIVRPREHREANVVVHGLHDVVKVPFDMFQMNCGRSNGFSRRNDAERVSSGWSHSKGNAARVVEFHGAI